MPQATWTAFLDWTQVIKCSNNQYKQLAHVSTVVRAHLNSVVAALKEQVAKPTGRPPEETIDESSLEQITD